MTVAGQNGGTASEFPSADRAHGSARLAKVLEDIAALADREERAEFLIETAERFRGVPATIASRPYPESHRVAGCESEAFVFACPDQQGKIHLHFAVENPQGISAKAMAVILEETLSGLGAEEIQFVPENIVHDIFGAAVSMGKGQGLMGMIRSAKSTALRASRRTGCLSEPEVRPADPSNGCSSADPRA